METLSADQLEAFRSRGSVGPFRAFAPDEMPPRRHIVERVLTTPSRYSLPQRSRYLDSRTVFALSSSPASRGRMASLLRPDPCSGPRTSPTSRRRARGTRRSSPGTRTGTRGASSPW